MPGQTSRAPERPFVTHILSLLAVSSVELVDRFMKFKVSSSNGAALAS